MSKAGDYIMRLQEGARLSALKHITDGYLSGSPENAVQLMKLYCAQFPEDANALYMLHEAQRGHGNHMDALATLAAAKAANPDIVTDFPSWLARFANKVDQNENTTRKAQQPRPTSSYSMSTGGGGGVGTIFDFVTDVSEKLAKDLEEKPPEAAALKKELDSHNLGTDKLEIDVKGDLAIIKGEVADRSTFEKAVIAVGNTLGISMVEAADIKIVAESASAESIFYTVALGDTLWTIAAKMYGTEVKYENILKANHPMLAHPDDIYPGQVLRIPNIEVD